MPNIENELVRLTRGHLRDRVLLSLLGIPVCRTALSAAEYRHPALARRQKQTAGSVLRRGKPWRHYHRYGKSDATKDTRIDWLFVARCFLLVLLCVAAIAHCTLCTVLFIISRETFFGDNHCWCLETVGGAPATLHRGRVKAEWWKENSISDRRRCEEEEWEYSDGVTHGTERRYTLECESEMECTF